MIKMIAVDKIMPNPDNPRRDLGDLTELAESIKENGVLQNLTVVEIPLTDKDLPEYHGVPEYKVIIGHRRLAAAKIAGLYEVPCVVAVMDHKTQVGTMLLENMQRVDLTIYEQAQGFQMMLNLGDEMKEISKQTGFSETTVRRRVKLLELDKKKFKDGTERGANLMDFMELFEIKDPALRDEALGTIGTDEFSWTLRRAKNKEKQNEWTEAMSAKLDQFAKRVDNNPDGFTIVRYYNDTITDEEVEIPEDAEEKEYAYRPLSHGQIILYVEVEGETEEEILAKERAEQEEAERKAIIKDIKDRAADSRKEFIYNLTENKVKELTGEVLALALEMRTSLYLWDNDFINIFEIKEGLEFDESKKLGINKAKESPSLSLLKIIYADEFEGASYFKWDGEYVENEGLDKLYNLLIKLGYQMSEEERQLQDGSHTAFVKDD